MLTNSVIKDLEHWLRYGSIVVKLVIVNVLLFIALLVTSLIMEHVFVSQTLLAWVGVPADLHALLYKPWTLFSYMFMHAGIVHVLFNMIALYWFGEIFVLYLGESKVLPIYIGGGLAGALLYLVIFNTLPSLKGQVPVSVLVGASGSIFALMFAAVGVNAAHKVNLFFFGEVRISYVALTALLISIINMINGSNTGGVLAHLGGALFGFAYIKSLQNGYDLFKPLALIKRITRPKIKVTHNAGTSAGAKRLTPDENEQEQIDKILDKISRSGYDSLSKEERDFLFKYSNK